MAEQTFTEEQHLAILADRVAKETAALTEQVESITSEKSDVEAKLDVAESAKVAAEQAAEKAVADLEAFKAEVEKAKTEGERKDTRIAAVKEAAAHLPEEFFADEKRVARIVAMDDDGFQGYVDDLKASAPGTGAPGSGGTPPRQTAMVGDEGQGGAGTSSAASTVLLGRFGSRGTETKGA